MDAGVGVGVGRERAPGLLAHELAAVLRLADEVVRGRGVQDHGCARDRVARAGRDRGPQVLADLDRERDRGLVGLLEEQVGPERHRVPREAQLAAARLARRGEPALLVVLLVTRQKRLRHDAEQAPRLEHGRRVEEPIPLQHRQAHDDHHVAPSRLREHARERPLGPPDERPQAEEEVAAGVARQPELRQHQHLDVLLRGLRHEVERRVRVALRVGDLNGRAGRRHAEKPVGGSGHGQILRHGGVQGGGAPLAQRRKQQPSRSSPFKGRT